MNFNNLWGKVPVAPDLQLRLCGVTPLVPDQGLTVAFGVSTEVHFFHMSFPLLPERSALKKKNLGSINF